MGFYPPDSPLLQHHQRFEDAVGVVQARRQADSPLKRSMIDMAERYNGDWTIPLANQPGEPEFPALSAAIIADAIDSSATRANDTLPTIGVPAVDPTAENHRKRARTRRRAWLADWSESQLPLRTSRAYRQYFGYGTFALIVEPDHANLRAKISTRDPLTSYPEPIGPDEVRLPADFGSVIGRSAAWLRRHYPECVGHIGQFGTDDDVMWDVLEWIDPEWIYCGLLGRRAPEYYLRNADGTTRYMTTAEAPMEQTLLLRAARNRAGVTPVVCPSTVTLDRVVSALTRVIPITDLMNKLAALDYLASERGVFPDMYAVGEQVGKPKIVGGQWNPGSTGEINLLENVRAVGTLPIAPGPATQTLLSTLERNARVSSGNPAVFQGEVSGSVRSGQTLTQLGAFAVDPRIQDAHRVMSYALKEINKAVAAVELGYWPERKYTVFSGWPGDHSHVSYSPNDIWRESTENVVEYPMPGMDAFNATVALAQLNGAGLISRKTARVKHPLVPDEEGEEQLLLIEALKDAANAATLQQVAGGGMALTDLMEVIRKVEGGDSLTEAFAKVQQAAQERQASAPPAPEGMMGPDGMPMTAAPESMPGVNQPGAGGEAGGAPPGGPASKAAEFEQLMQALAAAPQGAQRAMPTAAAGSY